METKRRKRGRGISTSVRGATVASVGKSVAGSPWIRKRAVPKEIASDRSSSWTSCTSSVAAARTISRNFFACTAIAPSRATSPPTQEVSETSRSVAAR
ncbi:MAG TPA: hypothetical protein PK570_01495 [Thermoanaerobaculia bacterium]|nr:hypothetical protein [Thermoanaerobaculia bacterium]